MSRGSIVQFYEFIKENIEVTVCFYSLIQKTKRKKKNWIPKLIIDTGWKDNAMVLSGSTLNIKNKTNDEELVIGKNSPQESGSQYNINFYFFWSIYKKFYGWLGFLVGFFCYLNVVLK